MDLSKDDKLDIIQATVKNLIKETQNLGEISQRLGTALKTEGTTGPDVLAGVAEVLSVNTAVTLALASVVMAHLNATGMLKHEVKLNS